MNYFSKCHISLFNISARKDFRHTRCGPTAHAGVFRHLSLHRGRRCAAARMAYCLQGEFGKLCGRKPQYAVSLLRGMTSSLMAFENQRSVSDALFGFQPKPCNTEDEYIPRGTYFVCLHDKKEFLHTWPTCELFNATFQS